MVNFAGIRNHGTIHGFVMLNPITNTPAVRGGNRPGFSHAKKDIARK